MGEPTAHPHQVFIGGPWQILGLDRRHEVQSVDNGFERRHSSAGTVTATPTSSPGTNRTSGAGGRRQRAVATGSFILHVLGGRVRDGDVVTHRALPVR